MRTEIINKLYEILNDIVERTNNGEKSFDIALTLDNDPYAGGKFALAMSYLIENDPKLISKWKEAWDYIAILPCTNWGKHYFLQALWSLHNLGFLERIYEQSQLDFLRKKLCWDEIIDNKTWHLNPPFPTNFYGVAFSIARLRFLLGWESQSSSQKILNKLIEHYKKNSSNGCVDETEGKGRFDRYSILLISEICQRHIDTGLEVNSWLKNELRQAAKVVLGLINKNGVGFLWGRSIGAYGDSAFNEILTVSMQLGVLTCEEISLASEFTISCSERYLNFWYDSEEKSVNLWFYGRQTDAYRNETRLVGENISLTCQHIYTQKKWVNVHDNNVKYSILPNELNKLKFIEFKKNKYTRGLFYWKDGDRVFSLPLINGDKGYFSTSPYYPIPFSEYIITGVTQDNSPLWIPELYDIHGRILQPLVWFANCGYKKIKNGWEIDINYSNLNVMSIDGDELTEPLKDNSCSCHTKYIIEPKKITRFDEFYFELNSINKIKLQCATFPSANKTRLFDDCLEISYHDNNIKRLVINGFDNYLIEKADLFCPYGGLEQRVTGCGNLLNKKSIALSWELHYV